MPKGLFIGNELDSATRKPRGRLELDPTDLLTHGLIVGMTGSGKTGLAIDLRGRVYAVDPGACAAAGTVHVLTAPPDYREVHTVTVGVCPTAAAVAATQ